MIDVGDLDVFEDVVYDVIEGVVICIFDVGSCLVCLGGDYVVIWLVLWVFGFCYEGLMIFYVDVYFDFYDVFDGDFLFYVILFVWIMEEKFVMCLV